MLLGLPRRLPQRGVRIGTSAAQPLAAGGPPAAIAGPRFDRWGRALIGAVPAMSGRYQASPLRPGAAPFDVAPGAKAARGNTSAAYTQFDSGTVDNRQEPAVPFNRRYPAQETAITRQVRPTANRWSNPPATPPIRATGLLLSCQVRFAKPLPAPPPKPVYNTYYAPAVAGDFPVQFSGFEVRYGGVTHELCLVAEADGHVGMGGIPKLRKNGVNYAIYLVETSDPNASPVRIRTSAGTKAIRLKT